MSVSPIQSSPFDTQAAMPVGVKKADATSSAASGLGNSTTNLSNTFLQLLTQELQNQDPTAPMDSTQMVGQMISLNQLEQLASINGKLPTSTSTDATGAAAAATANMASNAAPVAATHAAFQAASMGSAFGGTLGVPGSTNASSF